MNILRGLFRGLEALYGTNCGIDPVDYLVPYQAGKHFSQELVFLCEASDGTLEIGLALDEQILQQLELHSPGTALADASLTITLPVIEGLSHLLYLVEAARCERPVSGLELETQAEVDKLALCLFHRGEQARYDFAQLIDRLFYRFQLAKNISPPLQERYHMANRIALGFAHRIREHVHTYSRSQLRKNLQRFWLASMQEKFSLALAR